MAYDREFAGAARYLEDRLARILRGAKRLLGDDWQRYFSSAPVEFAFDGPSRVWLARIELHTENRAFAFEVKELQLAPLPRGERRESYFILAEFARDDRGGSQLFMNTLDYCLRKLRDPEVSDVRARVAFLTACVPPSARPLGIALEASRPVPGSDLHEARLLAEGSAGPLARAAQQEQTPKTINFREFL